MNRSPLLSLTLLALCVGFTGLLPAQNPAVGGEPSRRVEIFTPNAAAVSDSLTALGYDVLHAHAHGPATELEVIVSEADLVHLQAAGLQPITVERAAPLRSRFPQPDGTVPTGYRDLAALEAEMATLAALHPSLARVVDLSNRFGVGPTEEGRSIQAIVISDAVSTQEDEPRVLFVATHHCREIITPELAVDLAARLLNGYGVDPAVTSAVDGHEIWIIPALNPDGLEYVWNTNNFWRKNRRDNGDGTEGIDLNRNYDFGWAASCGGSTRTSSDTYRGPSAFSEVETRTIQAMTEELRFAKVIDWHSSGREVLLGYQCSTLPALLDNDISQTGTELANAVTALSYGTRRPSAEGEHQVWQIAKTTNFSFLVETGTSFQPPHSEALAESAALWPLHLEVLARTAPLSGRVTDAVSGAPLAAELRIPSLGWSNGETRFADAAFGRFHLWLPDGSYSVEVVHPGYDPSTVTMVAVAGQLAIFDVALSPQAPRFELDTTYDPSTGDLDLALRNLPSDALEGWTVVSLQTSGPVGGGPLAGLYADRLSLDILASPVAAGSPLHWQWPVAAPLFPAAPFPIPGLGGAFAGQSELDILAICRTQGAPGFVVSEVVRLSL